jgi:protease IV
VLHRIISISLALIAAPFVWCWGLIHRRITGRKRILVLNVEPLEDVYARQLLTDRLRRAAIDARVVAVVIRFRGVPGGWASCQEFRSAIRGLQSTGKVVYAWMASGGNATAWLASACDRVVLAPMGELGLVGTGLELVFFGEALSRFGVQPDFEAAGEYKSFGEPFTRSFPSQANREAMTELVQDLHEQLCQGIAQGRGLTAEAVHEQCARGPLSPEEAKECGLIDDVAYFDQVEEALKERFGDAARVGSFQRWARRDAILQWLQGWGDSGEAISVLHLEGSIVEEESSRGVSIASRQVVPMIKALREDDSVAAVVLHVNSPGGSALASDLIWHEVKLLNEEKPVVALFENVSASGGYYLSAPVSTIFARRSTLTGSIGVFGGKLVTRGAQQKLGISVEEVSASPNANFFSPNRRFTDAQRLQFRRSLSRFYDGFVERVAAGRGVAVEAVEPHCRGRVWTGGRAVELGLVDRLGGLADAIERARELAELPAGSYRRLDVVGWSRRSFIQTALRRNLGPLGTLWPLSGALDHPVTATTRSLGAVDFLMRHQQQVLAMLPFELRLR